jgi:hypothetical protein
MENTDPALPPQFVLKAHINPYSYSINACLVDYHLQRQNPELLRDRWIFNRVIMFIMKHEVLPCIYLCANKFSFF